MPVPVYITGSGLVTAAGRSVGSTFDAIAGGFVVTDHAVLHARLAGISKVASLGFEAATQAIDQAGWTSEQLDEVDTALVVCTSKGPVLEWLSPESAGSSAARASRPCLAPADTGETPALQNTFGLATLTTELADLTHISAGPRLLASAACASGLHGLARAVVLLRGGHARRVLVVAAEASVHPLFLGSFDRLGVLCEGGEPCRPFDLRRRGFHIADAAAAVCLELRPRDDPSVFIDRVAIAGDASHLTGSHSDGRVLRHVLQSVVAGSPVDFVHAHGTGTVLNDQVEIAAIDSAVARPVPVFSHKASIGHTLGASSLASVVLTAESHRRSRTLPNAASGQPIAGKQARIGTDAIELEIRTSLVTAAGFGGAVAAAVLKRQG